MTGVIGAMREEIKGLIDVLDNKIKVDIGGLSFFKGEYKGKSIVAVRSGVGKVNAAVAATIMIERFSPDIIINTGLAGGIGKGVKRGDVVASTACVQHDFCDYEFPSGQITGFDFIEFKSDLKAADNFYAVAQKDGLSLHRGVIASGDRFIADKTAAANIRDTFSALACDMESGAIAHVCHILGTPFEAVRIISDNAEDDATEEFLSVLEMAANRSLKLVKDYLENYAK